MKLDQNVVNLAKNIGLFFLEKNKENYEATEIEIQSMQITKLDIMKDGRALIELKRPGILIGKRGLQIEELSKHLKIGIHIVESEPSPIDSLIPYPLEDDEAMEDDRDWDHDDNTHDIDNREDHELIGP